MKTSIFDTFLYCHKIKLFFINNKSILCFLNLCSYVFLVQTQVILAGGGGYTYFYCNPNFPISRSEWCNGVVNCPNAIDEIRCPNICPVKYGYYRCPDDLRCVRSSTMCYGAVLF